VPQASKPYFQLEAPLIRLLKLWLPVLACMGIIFQASSIPGKDIPPLFPLQDVIFHFFIYGLLGYFFIRALKNTRADMNPAKAIFIAVVFCFIYGISDEFHQIFVPNRGPSAFDLLIDAAGGFIGGIFYR
jgi:VanZ family protein